MKEEYIKEEQQQQQREEEKIYLRDDDSEEETELRRCHPAYQLHQAFRPKEEIKIEDGTP